MYLFISFLIKIFSVLDFNFIEGIEYFKDLEWYYVGWSLGGFKRG